MPSMPMMQSSVPSMPAPPSSIMMSEDAQEYSELLKARNIARRYELLNLMRRLIQAKEKEAKKIRSMFKAEVLLLKTVMFPTILPVYNNMRMKMKRMMGQLKT